VSRTVAAVRRVVLIKPRRFIREDADCDSGFMR
jgi:hypothetical protein